jgi:hypothetical protein
MVNDRWQACLVNAILRHSLHQLSLYCVMVNDRWQACFLTNAILRHSLHWLSIFLSTVLGRSGSNTTFSSGLDRSWGPQSKTFYNLKTAVHMLEIILAKVTQRLVTEHTP